VITAVLRDEPPPVSSLRDVPPSLDRLVAACLAKSPDDRWHCADDLRRALDWVALESAAPATSPGPARSSRRWLALAPLVALAAAALVGLGRLSVGVPGQGPRDTREVRFRIDPPRGTSLLVPDGPPGTVQMALSPDGRALAFVATSPAGGQALYRRRLDSAEAERIPGTEGALLPAWSPDSRTLAFFTATEVKTVGDSGEPPRVVGRLAQPYGGTWIDERRLLVAGGGMLHRVSTVDGRTEPLHAAISDGRAFVAPQHVPGQSWFIVAETLVNAPTEPAVITARRSDGTLLTTMLTAHSRPVQAGPRTLVFIRNGNAFAQDFDPATGAMAGDAREVLRDVGGTAATSWASLSASATGDLAYAPRARQQFFLRWWSRSGQVLATVADDVHTPSLSPDQRFIAVRRRGAGGPPGVSDLFVIDADRGASQRVTFDPSSDGSPVWSPDSGRIAYTSMREGLDDLWIKPISPAPGTRIVHGPAIPSDWSPDGRVVAFHGTQAPRWGWQFDLGVVEVQPPHEVVRLTDTPFQEVQPRFSPNGRYLAYASNESGAYEVYLQPYPPDGSRTVISVGGGADPVWRRDGAELFYYAPDGYIMQVPMSWSPSVAPGKPERLFRVRLPALTLPYRSRFSVSADGQRFLALEEPDDPIAIHVIANWNAAQGRP
jgi:Tol biopolymer transport system component